MSYDYINRYYGKDFKAGQRVAFTECGRREGVVKRVRGSTQYVSIRFDDGSEGFCHPESVEVLAQPERIGE